MNQASLSMTTTKAIFRADLPIKQWPKAPFPALKYPLEDHVKENEQIENECLEKVQFHFFVDSELFTR